MSTYDDLVKYSEENDSDISSHLPMIYQRALAFKPNLIVELGVRTGQSSRVFSKVAEETDCRVIGCDIDPCLYDVHNGYFIQCDDVRFATLFKDSFKTTVDLLFIDTSHLNDHTEREIAAWFPLLSERALVMLHDTNLKKEYRRSNGSTGVAWDNERGVIGPLERYFGKKLLGRARLRSQST